MTSFDIDEFQRCHPWKGQNELFEKLEEMSKIAAMTEQERIQYNAYLRQYRDNMVVREAAIHEGCGETRQSAAECHDPKILCGRMRESA